MNSSCSQMGFQDGDILLDFGLGKEPGRSLLHYIFRGAWELANGLATSKPKVCNSSIK